VKHASDCAVHNEPAMRAGPCDCGAIWTGGADVPPDLSEADIRRAAVWIEDLMAHMRPDGDKILIDANAIAILLLDIERGGATKPQGA